MPIPNKLREFPDVGCEEEMANLDYFALHLVSDRKFQAYIIFYGGRQYRGKLARRGEAEARAERIKRYLIEERGIAPYRIVMVNGGYREEWTAELWLSPQGMKSPIPTPNVKPENMKFRRGKVSKEEYNCNM
jgi:hypothetical protein